MIAPETIARLKEAAGPKGYIDDPAEILPYCTPFRDGWIGATPLVLRPDSTEKLAELVRICVETGTPIVPQGGNTGLTAGSQPHDTGNEVVISTGRMNRIREIDLLNDTMTVEAGVILADIQRAAEEADRLFPLSLGAEGSCQIGGNLSTNAGGINVVRYGSTRALVHGLEVVTGDGETWDGLRGLRKDNAGYDLKQLFICAEGTLGIITAAVLRLFPKPTDEQTALAAVAGPLAAVELLALLRSRLGETISSFELLNRNCFVMLTRTMGHADPLPGEADWRVLLELAGQEAPGHLRKPLEAAFAETFEAGLIIDAIVASSEAQAVHLWQMCEDIAEAQKLSEVEVKHGILVPVSKIPDFVARADAALAAVYPAPFFCTFGHVGDGNLHYNPLQPEGWDGSRWKAETEAVNRMVHDIVDDLGGSITAERGVGRLRMAELAHYKSPVELDLMRRLKRAFDPANVLNPGKLLMPEDR